MKLLFILTYYTPHWTGLTQYAKLLAEGLVERGHAITVLTTRQEASLPVSEKMNDVDVHRMNPLFRLSRTLFSLEMWLRLPFYIRNADRVVVFLPSSDVFPVAILSRIFRRKLYLIHNGDLVLTKGLVNRIIEAMFFTLTDMSMHLCQKIIVNTVDYARKSELLNRHKEKWIEIYPPIGKLAPTKEMTKELREKIGKYTPIVGFAGRFVEEKGFDILLKAIPLILKKFPDARFVYAGSKVRYETFFEQCEPLIKQAGKHLIFLGKLNREDMGSFYPLCDVFVLSSRSDFFPFVQIEALLAGIPVVVTDIPGARVPVTRTKLGEIVKPENPEALARGIYTVVSHRKKYDQYASGARHSFQRAHSLKEHEKVFST